MQRRQFMGATATALATSGLLTSVAGARERGYLPNERVPHARVHPWMDGDPVPAGDWIVHRIGWVDYSRERVEHFLEVIDIDGWIDGEAVPNPDQYWRDIHQDDDGRWFVYWKYATPPKSQGEHSFRTRLVFQKAHESEPDDYEQGDEFDKTGTYEVKAGR